MRMEREDVVFSVEVLTGDNGRVVVIPRGELDLATQGELRGALGVARSSGDVVLDLGELRFLDTSGLRLILEIAEASRRDGFRFTVLRGSAAVQRLFEVAGVEELVPFEEPT
jgi:anti-anti-sigma factor